jgi:small subunit ribosomal protein S17
MPKKVKFGTVVSNKMDKTIVVMVTERHPHSKYGKIMSQFSKFKAHDEENICNEGDVVAIIESRPISKSKTWKLKEVLQSASV